MPEQRSNEEINQIDHIFTELFQMLNKPIYINDHMYLDYTNSEIKAILLHVENAITGILHGLQAVGNLIAECCMEEKKSIPYIGHFLILIGNLLEALCVLQTDCIFQLYENKNAIA